ncbi:hypothetical protein TNCV_2647691 [Trichonephila clavipes]|nr:hypothetical protein TNCV_2647691 [Trichonephila clavipes]
MSTQLRCVKSPRPRQMVLSYRLSTSMSANQVREIVNNLLLKLLVSLFKIHASEKELGKILLRVKNQVIGPVPVVISNLQHCVSLLELWLTDWKIKVNASKSAYLMFTRRHQLPVGLTPVTIFGQTVTWVNVVKYLGLFLDAKLTFAHHIEQARKKVTVHLCSKSLSLKRAN